MDECASALIAIGIIANHPIVIVSANGFTNRQRQLILDAYNLITQIRSAFLICTVLQYGLEFSANLSKWFCDDIVLFACHTLECESLAHAILFGIRLNNRFADRFTAFVVVRGSEKTKDKCK